MYRKFLIPLPLCLVATAALAADDVTMQVLDDTRDVGAVLRALRDSRPTAVRDDEEPRSRRARRQTSSDAPVAERRAVLRLNEIMTAGLDREEESEGEIEDFDIPEDLEIPEPEEDE